MATRIPEIDGSVVTAVGLVATPLPVEIEIVDRDGGAVLDADQGELVRRARARDGEARRDRRRRLDDGAGQAGQSQILAVDQHLLDIGPGRDEDRAAVVRRVHRPPGWW